MATEISTANEQQDVNGTEPQPAESVLLTREAILSVKWTPKIERVEVPEWGGHVFVKEMSGKQRDNFELSTVKRRGANREQNLENLRARLVAWVTVDASGQRLFSEEDIPALGNKSAKALSRVYDTATKLSQISDEDVEELVQELGEDRSSDSGTA